MKQRTSHRLSTALTALVFSVFVRTPLHISTVFPLTKAYRMQPPDSTSQNRVGGCMFYPFPRLMPTESAATMLVNETLGDLMRRVSLADVY